MTENKQRARYYRLTAKGKRRLVVEEARWNQMVEAIARFAETGAVRRLRCGFGGNPGKNGNSRKNCDFTWSKRRN